MSKLAKPDYAVADRQGRVTQLFCKVCGSEIANSVGPELRRGHNYAELKMELSSGGFHVTCGCKRCLKKTMPMSTLEQMYKADMSIMHRVTTTRPIAITQIDTSQRGIV